MSALMYYSKMCYIRTCYYYYVYYLHPGLTCKSNKAYMYKHIKVLSTETGYQQTFHQVYIVAHGAPLICCLAKRFAKQYSLLNCHIENGPCTHVPVNMKHKIVLPGVSAL